MKIINDLIVLSVPEGMSNFVVGKNEVWVYDEDGITDNIELPPGQYEIIGTEQQMYGTNNMRYRAIKAAGYEWYVGFLINVYNDLKREHGLQTTDTNDLLFIHKLK